jgi:predicted TPR repeat methyltransferase
MRSDQASDYPEEDATQYDQQVVERCWHGHEILFGLMYEFVNPGETLLDIGIGTGISSFLFHKAGLRISGFDSSQEMLEGCKSKGFAEEIIRYDLRNVPYPYKSDSFNHVISLGVLNFFADLAPVFKEASRIIKSMGIFGFTVEEQKPGLTPQYSMSVDTSSARAKEQFEITMHRHSDQHVRTLLSNAGFMVLKDLDFLADRYPGQGIEVWFKVYIAQKNHQLFCEEP